MTDSSKPDRALDFYETLAGTLSDPITPYYDAHYHNGTLPTGTKFEIDDYNSYWVLDPDNESRMIGEARGDGQLELKRRQLLEAGRACLNVVLKPRADGSRTYVVGRPATIHHSFYRMLFPDPSIDPTSDNIAICDIQTAATVTDPLDVPNLAAVYRSIVERTGSS